MDNEEALQKFDPTVSELNDLVAKSQLITEVDLGDSKQLAVVKQNRIALRDARVKITKIGKGLRDDANKFSAAVIAKEKELVAIISPEEDRLSQIEEYAKAQQIRAERIKNLPAFKARITEAGLDQYDIVTDEELLNRDEKELDAYFYFLKEEQINAEHAKMQKERDELEAEKIKVADAARLKEAEEKGRQDAIEKQADLKAKKEKEMEELEEVQNFLKESGVYDGGEYKVEYGDTQVKVYKLHATYTK